MKSLQRGFTLIELLIAMALVAIMLGSIAVVLGGASEITTIGESRIHIYEQARLAADYLEQDLQGCLPFNRPPADLSAPFGSNSIPTSQRFILENGYSAGPLISYGSSGTWQSHVLNAADRIKFSAITSAGDTMQQVRVIYELKRYGEVYGVPLGMQGIRTGRELFALVRRLRDPNKPDSSSPNVTDKNSNIIPDVELCHFVTSFNIEYYANNRQYCQLENGPSPYGPGPCPPADPLGDDDYELNKNSPPPVIQGMPGWIYGNDTQPGGAFRLPSIRITMRIVDGQPEREERTLSRVIWIPVCQTAGPTSPMH